jgi:uncharacterized paraquat-inducible protein A
MTPVTETIRTALRICLCGQDLDGTTRSHCPRCGRQLHEHRT